MDIQASSSVEIPDEACANECREEQQAQDALKALGYQLHDTESKFTKGDQVATKGNQEEYIGTTIIAVGERQGHYVYAIIGWAGMIVVDEGQLVRGSIFCVGEEINVKFGPGGTEAAVFPTETRYNEGEQQLEYCLSEDDSDANYILEADLLKLLSRPLLRSEGMYD